MDSITQAALGAAVGEAILGKHIGNRAIIWGALFGTIPDLDWFSQGWWIARPHAQGIWIADMRFGETRIYDDKPGMVDSRFMFSWSFEPKREGDRLINTRPSERNAKDTLRRIGHRILGNAKQWEANPRLAGMPGALPESLRVVE